MGRFFSGLATVLLKGIQVPANIAHKENGALRNAGDARTQRMEIDTANIYIIDANGSTIYLHQSEHGHEKAEEIKFA